MKLFQKKYEVKNSTKKFSKLKKNCSRNGFFALKQPSGSFAVNLTSVRLITSSCIHTNKHFIKPIKILFIIYFYLFIYIYLFICNKCIHGTPKQIFSVSLYHFWSFTRSSGNISTKIIPHWRPYLDSNALHHIVPHHLSPHYITPYNTSQHQTKPHHIINTKPHFTTLFHFPLKHTMLHSQTSTIPH